MLTEGPLLIDIEAYAVSSAFGICGLSDPWCHMVLKRLGGTIPGPLWCHCNVSSVDAGAPSSTPA